MISAHEMKMILALVSRARSVLEIGVHIGRTAKTILDNVLTVKRYVGIDVPPHHRTALKLQQAEVPRQAGALVLGRDQFRLIVRPRGSFDVKASELGQFDAVFIDGDHSRAGVENDSALASEVVNPQSGVIIWHDYGKPEAGVTEVLDELVRKGRRIDRIIDTWLAFEKRRE